MRRFLGRILYKISTRHLMTRDAWFRRPQANLQWKDEPAISGVGLVTTELCGAREPIMNFQRWRVPSP